MVDEPNPKPRRKTEEQRTNHRNYMRKYMRKKKEIERSGKLERAKGYEQAMTDMLPEILEQRVNLSRGLTNITKAVADGTIDKMQLAVMKELLADQQKWLDRVDPVAKKLEIDSKHTSVDVARLLQTQGSDTPEDDIIDVDAEVDGSE